METPKIKKSEGADGIKNHPEALGMKENIINRARILLNENGELSRKVLGRKWNTVEKRGILDSLGECRIETKETLQDFEKSLH